MQPDPINEVTKRTQRYWYEDGIWEIGFGLVNALLGGFYLLTARLDWSGPAAIILVILQMGALIGLFTSINKIVNFLKERITYPRTGYVAYRKPAPSTRLKKVLLSGLIAAGMGALIGAMATIPQAANRMPLVISIIVAGMLCYIGYRFNLLHLFITAVLTILWGYALSLYPLGELYSTGAFFAGYGTLILLSGLATLFLYLRRTQPMANDLFDPTLPENQRDEQ